MGFPMILDGVLVTIDSWDTAVESARELVDLADRLLAAGGELGEDEALVSMSRDLVAVADMVAAVAPDFGEPLQPEPGNGVQQDAESR